MICDDDIILLSTKINTVKDRDTLLQASKEVDLEIK
jgi:hypothetical protein